MAKNMSLWWGAGSPPCWRVQIALEEKNLQGYNSKLLSFEKGEHKSKEVMELNPRGQLPVFKHEGIVINESYGACLYLENQFKSQGNNLVPESPADQALMYQRMFEGISLFDAFKSVMFYDRFVPENERHDSARERNKQTLTTELTLWEGYLRKMSSGSYLGGSSFSLADVIVFPVIAMIFRFGLSSERYPKLADYHDRLKERPSIKNSWPPHWLENPEGPKALSHI